MTMPHERTRSVIQTREFLQSLVKNSDLPLEISNEAFRLLRHFPTAEDVLASGRIAEFISSADTANPMREAVIQLHPPIFSSSMVFKQNPALETTGSE